MPSCECSEEEHGDLIEAALQLARSTRNDWEGDIRDGEIYVGSIPSGECEPFYYVIWKQDNNGQTFVVSQVRLPWLHDYECWHQRGVNYAAT